MTVTLIPLSDFAEVEDSVLLEAFTTYCKLVNHISGSFDEIEKDNDAFSELVRWAKEVLVPAIQQK